jgi:hypothetical protein
LSISLFFLLWHDKEFLGHRHGSLQDWHWQPMIHYLSTRSSHRDKTLSDIITTPRADIHEWFYNLQSHCGLECGRLCPFLEHIIWHNCLVMIIYTHNSDQNMSVEHEFLKINNLSPQTLVSWNGCTLAHYVQCVTKLALKGLLGALPNITGRGLTIL